MKKLISILFVLVLLSMTAFAANDDFVGSVEIVRDDAAKTITVTVTKSDALETLAPRLSIPCDFSKAHVKRGDAVIASTLANGKITFQITAGETYTFVICDGSAEATPTDPSPNPPETDDKPSRPSRPNKPSKPVKPAEPTVPEAEPTAKQIILTLGSPVAYVDGAEVINDVAPVARNWRTMLPIRLIAEALGATVDWDADNQRVTIVKDELVIEIYIGSAIAYVNGQSVQLDSAAFAENNRTYLPLRFVAETLGAFVEWDQATQTVTITAK